MGRKPRRADGGLREGHSLLSRSTGTASSVSGSGGSRRQRPGRVGLVGATKLTCAPFNVSGISLDSTEEDILLYCHDKGVTVTGVYMLLTRVWGTRSAKLFAVAADGDTIISECFWPTHVMCRPWLPKPPRRAPAEDSSPHDQGAGGTFAQV